MAKLVCGRWSKWIVLALWLGILVVAGPMAGKLTSVEKNDNSAWLPGAAEATQVMELQKQFQPDDIAPAVIVYERDAGITGADQAKAAADVKALAAVPGVSGQILGPVPAQDGKALQVIVPIKVDADGWDKIVDVVDDVKAITGTGENGLGVYLTGPAGNAADSAKAFEGIDSALLYTTLIVVAIILLITYRSPVLWLLPIMTAGAALISAQAVIYLLAKHAGLVVNAQSAGILTVLVFGAGTDYALLLVARYREELRKHDDRHEAMALALHRAGPAIIASAATVAIGMSILSFAEVNSTSGLGPVAAIGIVVGLLAMITLLPALLVDLRPVAVLAGPSEARHRRADRDRHLRADRQPDRPASADRSGSSPRLILGVDVAGPVPARRQRPVHGGHLHHQAAVGDRRGGAGPALPGRPGPAGHGHRERRAGRAGQTGASPVRPASPRSATRWSRTTWSSSTARCRPRPTPRRPSRPWTGSATPCTPSPEPTPRSAG